MARSRRSRKGETNPWKFAAGYLDSNTGLYKYGTRYYDPTLGRWTQQNPVGGSLGDLNSANRYVYANDDPVNMVDPSGQDLSVACLVRALGVKHPPSLPNSSLIISHLRGLVAFCYN